MAQGKRVVPKGTVFGKATKRAHPGDNDKPAKRTHTEGAAGEKKVKPAAKSGSKLLPKDSSKPVSKAPSKPSAKTPSKPASKAPSKPHAKAPSNASKNTASKPEKSALKSALKQSPKHEKGPAKAAQKPTPKPTAKDAATEEPRKSTTAKPRTPRTPKEPKEPAEALAPTAMRIVAGSYERLLYGLIAIPSRRNGELAVTIEPQFVFPAHVSSIRAVACAGVDSKWLVTGGTDETIKVWDMRRLIAVGALMGHEGSIMSLSFPSRTFMLSASEDSTINLYRTRDWSLLRTLRGHTGRVNAAVAHPSGRLALSVGADKTIRMWDLMRGVGAASVKIGVEADQIRWNANGDRFAVLALRQVMVFATDMTKVAEIELPRRVHDMTFYEKLILVACDDGAVHIYDLEDLIEPENEDDAPTPTEIGRFIGHNNRVRSVGVVRVRVGDADETLAATISSDGFIRVFNLGEIIGGAKTAVAIAEYNTKRSRLTCLSVAGYLEAGDAMEEEEAAADEDEDDEDEDEDEDEDGEEYDEDAIDAELEELEEKVRRAREAGIVFEDDDDDDDEDDEDDDDDDDNAEAEDEVEDEAEDA
ncbi:Protein mak11 [Malassezia cuniculi]|uniref:Protein mak11 n=1 Tax=Malassezia cuniculi TaxID=948313 RepID=A0AAF0J613_9BASI|nr:Protein mak11 [Malassezia cuniculi]